MLKKLSPQEALIQKFEDTDRQLEQYRLSDHKELKNVEMRLGRRESHEWLISRICKLNSNLFVEDSINWVNGLGIYYKDQKGEKRYTGIGFEKGYLPEYSYILTDAADLPVKEVRGWRTVVMRLLKTGHLSWKQVVETFGDPLHAANERWQRETAPFRQ